MGGPHIVVRPPNIPPIAPAIGPTQRSVAFDKGADGGFIRVDAEKTVTLMPKARSISSRSRSMAKSTPINKKIINTEIITGKRRIGANRFFAIRACQRLVTKMGMIKIEKVVIGLRKLVSMAMVTIGSPIPVTPLTKPPKQIAAPKIAIKSRLSPNTVRLVHEQQVCV